MAWPNDNNIPGYTPPAYGQNPLMPTYNAPPPSNVPALYNKPQMSFDYGSGETTSLDNLGKIGVKQTIPDSLTGGAGDASKSLFSQDSMFGKGGWFSPALSAVGTGVNAYLGLKGLGLAEDQFDFQKDSWNKNFAQLQDQYYRKLNAKRSNRAIINQGLNPEGGGYNNAQEIADFYDSGTNLEGDAGWSPSQSAFAGATPNSGPIAAPAPSGAATSGFAGVPGLEGTMPLRQTFGTGGLEGVLPISAADATPTNTNVDRGGVVKRRKKKSSPTQSDNTIKEEA